MNRRKQIVVFAVLFMVVIVILTALTIFAVGESDETIRKRWEAAGGVWSLAEMKPEAIAPDQNAATQYRQAFAAIESLPPDVLDAIRDSQSAEERDAALTAVPDELFDLALAAARRDKCDWESPLYEDPFVLLEHLGHARSLAIILAANLRRHADRGDDVAAMEQLETIMRLAEHVAADPILISHLVSMAIEQVAVDHFREAYHSRESFPPNARRYFERRAMKERLREVILGEGTLAAHMMEELGASALPRVLRGREMRLHRLLILDIVDELEKPWPQQQIDDMVNDIPFWAAGLDRIMPAYHRAVQRSLNIERRLLAMQIAINIRAYRDEHGHYPDQWQMPIDPMTGEPIEYERTDDGFIISAPAIDRDPPLYCDWP